MDVPSRIRIKPILAALMLVLVSAFSALHNFKGEGYVEIGLKVGLIIFSAYIAFIGVFGSPLLQLLWGWCLTVAALTLAVLCVVLYRGSELIFGLGALFAAIVGSYLLLFDSSVRTFRRTLKKGPQ